MICHGCWKNDEISGFLTVDPLMDMNALPMISGDDKVRRSKKRSCKGQNLPAYNNHIMLPGLLTQFFQDTGYFFYNIYGLNIKVPKSFPPA